MREIFNILNSVERAVRGNGNYNTGPRINVRPPMGGFGVNTPIGRIKIPPVIPIPVPRYAPPPPYVAPGQKKTPVDDNEDDSVDFYDFDEDIELEKYNKKYKNPKKSKPPKEPKQKKKYLPVRIFACIATALLSLEFVPYIHMLPYFNIGTAAMLTTIVAYIGGYIAKDKIKYPVKLSVLKWFWSITAGINCLELISYGDLVECVIVGGVGIAGYYAIKAAAKFLTSFENKSFKEEKPKRVIKEKHVKETPKKEEKVKKSNTGNPELDKIIDQGNDYIAKLKQADIDIEHEGISNSIVRMENACQGIFEYVKDHPERIPQIQKFLNYYLPTTLKLLESYKKMDKQGYKGDNISATMFEIEGMMNTIAVAFEKQLDSLFSQEAMDIQADISVFDTILKQEGLSD